MLGWLPIQNWEALVEQSPGTKTNDTLSLRHWDSGACLLLDPSWPPNVFACRVLCDTGLDVSCRDLTFRSEAN